MLITPHSLTGATIAILVPNPVIAIPLSISSHFVLDIIPHWQETLYPYVPTKTTWVRILVDLLLSFFLVSWIIQSHPNISSLIWLTAFTANIPDLDSVASVIPSISKIKLFKKYYDWHNEIQKETSSLIGLIPQITVSALCLLVGKLNL
ncbi:hypothetical protein C4577_03465 [Candidatus Parcubacteria bacterium]|nr:MAG: hypothetical protein C4577_03465 [Candidatus Parcubacteria bacterium]